MKRAPTVEEVRGRHREVCPAQMCFGALEDVGFDLAEAGLEPPVELRLGTSRPAMLGAPALNPAEDRAVNE